MKEVLVGVVLVSYNSEGYIKDCLSSLKKQTYKNFKTILVDNNSSDNSIKLAKKLCPKIRIIKNKKNLGFAGGNNIGIKNAFRNKKTKYAICLNIDTKLDKDWLRKLVKVAEENENVGSVQSKVLLYNKPSKINTAGNEVNFLGVGYCGNYLRESSTQIKIKQIAYSSGSSVLYSRQALEDVGLFDEDFFMYQEDLDLSWRLALKGYKNLLSPKSIVYHKYCFSKAKYKFYYLEKNRLIVLLKNYSIKTILLISPIGIFFELGMIFYSIFNHFFIEKMKSYFSFILNLPKTIKKRKHIQKTRELPDREIIKNFSSEIRFEEVDNLILNKFVNPILRGYWETIRRII